MNINESSEKFFGKKPFAYSKIWWAQKIVGNRALMKPNSWLFYEMNWLKKIVFGKWPRIEILERF